MVASEINASIHSNPNLNYRLVPVDIPPPDTNRLIQNVTAHNVNVMSDPRLHRISGSFKSPGQPSLTPFVSPRPTLDPRRRPSISITALEPPRSPQPCATSPMVQPAIIYPYNPTASCRTMNQTISPSVQPPIIHPYNPNASCHTLDKAAVQASSWYRALSTHNKIVVNQQLSILTAELQTFLATRRPNQWFDLSFIKENALLQQTLVCLRVFVDENGFCHTVTDPEPEPEPNHFEVPATPFETSPVSVTPTNTNFNNTQPPYFQRRKPFNQVDTSRSFQSSYRDQPGQNWAKDDDNISVVSDAPSTASSRFGNNRRPFNQRRPPFGQNDSSRNFQSFNDKPYAKRNDDFGQNDKPFNDRPNAKRNDDFGQNNHSSFNDNPFSKRNEEEATTSEAPASRPEMPVRFPPRPSFADKSNNEPVREEETWDDD